MGNMQCNVLMEMETWPLEFIGGCSRFHHRGFCSYQPLRVAVRRK